VTSVALSLRWQSIIVAICCSGVLCGRATWQDAIPIYAKQGVAAMEAWLAERGRLNIESINAVLAQGAIPWWDAYGGKDNIEVVEPGNAAH
jgi:tagatose 1,6-diphosphate aldolase